jgi:ATP synthase F1 gamma subunit
MKRSAQFYKKHQDVVAIQKTASIFENIASIRIRQVKEQVLASRGFFNRLWSIYTSLRIDEKQAQAFGHSATSDRQVMVLISSNYSLVGQVDAKLVDTCLKIYDPKTTDLIMIGQHGERILKDRGITSTQSFELPDITKPIDVENIVTVLSQYEAPVVYYPSYKSLSEQEIVSFTLIEAVRTLSNAEQREHPEGLIYAHECIFEPSEEELITYLESMMVQVILTEVILEASLAHFASRFTAMNFAEDRAGDIDKILSRTAKRLKRLEHDELERSYKTHPSGVFST